MLFRSRQPIIVFCLLSCAVANKKTINNQTDWHSILQGIFDEHLSQMSGKVVLETERELHQFYQIDYYCRVGSDLPESELVPGIRPFDHFLEHNLIEYKSIHETLNERVFQDYLARASLFESRRAKEFLKGKVTLTILLTREPVGLLQLEKYSFQSINPWKYYLDDRGTPVYLLIQKGTRNISGGEPFAYLQVLEGNKNYQKHVWADIVNQNLTGEEALKRIMIDINREAFMSIRQQIIEEVRPMFLSEGEKRGLVKGEKRGLVKGEKRGLIKGEKRGFVKGELEAMKRMLLAMLTNFAPKLLPRFKPQIESAKTLKDCKDLEADIYKAISLEK